MGTTERPVYELMLVGAGRPELRLTDEALAVGELIELADKLWRVERAARASRETAELRYVLIAEGASALRAEARQARGRARAIRAEVADTRDRSGVLRDAAERVQRQAQRAVDGHQRADTARALLLLFDCEGTLSVGEDALALPCMVDALSELSGVALPEDAFEGLDHEARCARRLARETIRRRGLPPVDLDRSVEHTLERYFDRLASEEEIMSDWRLPEGAEAAFERLAQENVRLALVADMPEEIVRFRLDVLGVGRFFPRGQGAFGSEFEDREELIQAALRRARSWPPNAVLIGDTSRDLRTARKAGLRTIAVAVDGQESPANAGGDLVVDSMAELPDAVRFIAAL